MNISANEYDDLMMFCC